MENPVLVLFFFLALMFLILFAKDENLREKTCLIIKIRFQNLRKKAEIKKFFNEYSPAAKKLYEECARNNIAVGFVKNHSGAAVSGPAPVIALNNFFLKEISKASGLLELIFVHELGHILADNEKPWTEFWCAKPGKLTFCRLSDEIAAWEKAFLILKEMHIKIDDDVFWREAALRLGTHLNYFQHVCDKIKTPRCPKITAFLFTEIMTKFRNFKQEDLAEIEKIMFSVRNNEIVIPEKNFIIE